MQRVDELAKRLGTGTGRPWRSVDRDVMAASLRLIGDVWFDSSTPVLGRQRSLMRFDALLERHTFFAGGRRGGTGPGRSRHSASGWTPQPGSYVAGAHLPAEHSGGAGPVFDDWVARRVAAFWLVWQFTFDYVRGPGCVVSGALAVQSFNGRDSCVFSDGRTICGDVPFTVCGLASTAAALAAKLVAMAQRRSLRAARLSGNRRGFCDAKNGPTAAWWSRVQHCDRSLFCRSPSFR